VTSTPRPVIAASLAAMLSAGPAFAQIIAPGQTGQDLPRVPTMQPQPIPGIDRSWTLRRGKRPPPPRWERENGFAAPPAYGGPRDARPRGPYLEESGR